MLIIPFPSGPVATNTYIIVCPATHVAAVVDPAQNSTPKVLKYLTDNQLHADKILLTHSHWDHIADTAILKKSLNVPVYIHSLDAPNLENPGADLLRSPFTIEGVKPDYLLKDNEIIKVGEVEFQVIHTPGHTEGGVCFYSPEKAILISGDTLFKGSMGRIDFPLSNADDMWESLIKLSKLPKETTVYPGHGGSTTIGQESWMTQAKDIFG